MKHKNYFILFVILFLYFFSASVSLADTKTVQFQAGWNMFSMPVNKTISVSSFFANCPIANSVYHYNPSTGAYETVSTMQPGLGYWASLSSPCSISIDGTALSTNDFPELKSGNNQIGSLSVSTLFSSIKGNCNVLSGPTKYNPITRSYENVTSLEPGVGYFIKVGSNCKFGTAVTVTSDLVAYYKMDEGSGTKAYDSSPLKNDGTLFNNPAWVSGKSGKALQFTGSNYVEAPDSSSLGLANAITLEAWVYPSSLSGWTNLIEKDQIGGYKLGFYNNQPVFTLYGLWDAFATGTISLNQWSHIAATYDKQNVKIYINGVLNTIIPHIDSIGVGTSPLDIGRRRSSGSSYFNGVIDEVKIWNRALTADEIKKEYGVQQCLDGTQYGQCSLIKPKYCDNGNLVNKCSQCGCDSGTCQSDGTCSGPSVTPGGLKADYYDNIDFTNLKLTRTDSTINFDWSTGSPDSSIGVDTFSVRWQGYIKADYSETYTFYVTTDDGSRVWIDNNLVIDSWVDQWVGEYPNTGSIALTQGWHTIKYEYYENGGNAVAKLSYSSPSVAKQIIPSDHLGTSGTVQTCSDSTTYGSCSSTKPKYCSSGTLINSCSQCGCDSGYTCNSTTGSCYITPPTTCDSTCKNKGYSSGNCRTGTSTNTNLAVIPNDWGDYKLYAPRILYDGNPATNFEPQICHLNYNVVRTAGIPSIQLEPHQDGVDGNVQREVDAGWRDIHPGDHIVAKCWMQTGASTYTNPYGCGARIGIDFYGANGSIEGVSGPHGTLPQPPQDIIDNFVPWSTSQWTQRTIDMIVPATMPDANGNPQIPTGMILWVQATPQKIPTTGYNGAYAWFSDCELYINPTSGGSATCQSGESSIGQDGCSSNNLCCCIQSAAQCTPANDIIKNTLYSTGSCQASSTFGWSHSTCGSTSICNQGSCKLVNVSITSYTLPSGKYARSDSISIPYTIKNTGDTQWCFLTESGVTKADSTNAWPNKFNSVSPASSASDSLSYPITCSDSLGTWSGLLYTYTDTGANGGWKVWGTPTYTLSVVECLNDADCTNCKGSGYTCDSTNKCIQGPSVTSGGLKADYYDNIDFTNLKLTRTDSTINFNWSTSSPDTSIGVDTFSVRWQGYVKADYSETYTFYVTTDDGSRVWIDNNLVIDSWVDQWVGEYPNTGSIALTQGWHTIKYEYYENGGNAVAKLSYSSPSVAKQIIPSDHLGTSGTVQTCDSTCKLQGYTTGNCEVGTSTVSTSSGTGGEIYLWMGSWIWDSSSESPTALGKRIATAHDLYGRPEWVETGNWGAPQATSKMINFFHSHGIKVSCRIWSKYGAVPLNTILHDMNASNGISGSVDYQISIGPQIDMIMIDETSQDASKVSYYTSISQYVRGLGKPVAMNVGGPIVTTNNPSTITLADVSSYEFYWYGGIAQANANPAKKFMGASMDWAYQNPTLSGVQTPNSSDPASGRPAYTYPLSEDRAIWETRYAWQHGIYYFDVRPGDDTTLPDWWEDYLSQLPRGASTSGITTGSCQSGESSIGQDSCSSNNLCCCKSDLVGYWKLDEGSGSTAFDSSPNKNNGALINGPLWTTGKVGKALQFDGVDDYVKVNDSPSLRITGDLTISSWVYWKGSTSLNMIAEKGNNDDDNYGFSILPNGALRFEFNNTNSWIHIDTPASLITPNTWQHVAVVYDDTNNKIYFYKNGAVANSTSTTYSLKSSQTYDLHIGCEYYVVNGNPRVNFFNGTIDEVKIWNRALTQTEIQTEYGVQTCSDGTLYNQCSVTKPKYCSSGTLTNACGQCGCDSGYTCNTTSGSCYLTPPLTCDSTCKLQGYSSGNCRTGTTGTNLAVIPDGWQIDQYTNHPLDYNVVRTAGKPSIRLEPSTPTYNSARECDAKWYSVKPGDHIIAKIWIHPDVLAGYVPYDPNNYWGWRGGRLGIDLNGGGHNLEGYPFVGTWKQEMWVQWNTPEWTQVVYDFIVPSTAYTMDTSGNAMPSPTQISSMGMWAQVLYNTDPVNVWFADAELYINPTNTSTATCQSGESSIGQDGCSSNNLCCCSGAVQQCSSLAYPTDKWQRIWYTHSTGACLGNGPDQTSTTFDNDWSTGTVAYNQADDIQFSSSRTINFATAGTYNFTLGSDDGARLWIDDVLKIDKWVDRDYTTDSVNVQLTAGNHRVRIDWYENGGAARVSFSYSQTVTPGGLKGDYYDNIDLTNLKLTRTDSIINFDWSTGSPDASIGVDTFSVRWQGYVKADYSETYTFYATTDDGSRVWIDNQLVIDSWVDQWVGEYPNTGSIALTAGWHTIKYEFYENAGNAVAKLSYSSPSVAKQIIPSDHFGIGVTVQQCSDGTQYGQCSATKPKYCSSGTLINSCSQCGCDSGYTCNTTTNACYITPQTNCDSTCKAQSYASGSCRTGGTSGTNLAVIPDDFSLVFRSGIPQYAFVDYSVFHYGTVSIRIDPTIPSESREIDGKWRNCKPGDHIVMKCWIKAVGPANSDPYVGARIGIDLYAPAPQAGYVNIVDGHPHDGAEHLYSELAWGSDWTLKQWDFIIPSTFYTKDNAGNTIPAVQINGLIPWLDARPSDWANSHAYFADCELYINPTSTGTCQSGESSIGQDSCSSNNLCCCK